VLWALVQDACRATLDQLAAAEDSGLEAHGERQAKVAGEDQERHATIAVGDEQGGEQRALARGPEPAARLVADEEVDVAIEPAGELRWIGVGTDEAGAPGRQTAALSRRTGGQQPGNGLSEKGLAAAGATHDGKTCTVGEREVESGNRAAAGDGDTEARELKRHDALP